MAEHRKIRPAVTRVAGTSTPSPSTAALTSVALLSQSASTAPADDGMAKPSIEEVEKKLDDLYRRADSPAEKPDAAKGRIPKQRRRVDSFLDEVAKRASMLNKARGALGSRAAAEDRADTAASLLANTPQGYFDQAQLMSRLAARQKGAVDDHTGEQSATTRRGQETAERLEAPAGSEHDLQQAKSTVQKKLADARVLLSQLTADAIAGSPTTLSPSVESSVDPSVGSSVGSAYATKAEKALAFARAQIGKPYVWGAAGPESYDCSGLAQAAWKAAGVSLPRRTPDQAGAGTTVLLSEAQPGDLVFFYDDLSHVGICTGDGMMIHAPRPGTYVREESVHYDGEPAIHSVVRPA